MIRRTRRKTTASMKTSLKSNSYASPLSASQPILDSAVLAERESAKPQSVDASTSPTIEETFGTKTERAAMTIVRQLMEIEDLLLEHSSENRLREVMESAVTLIQEFEPKTGVQTFLAVQMIATQRLIMVFLKRAALEGQPFEATNANVNRATRLMRVFVDQLEAMAKLQGKSGQQHMVVEHVTVAAGGQAIVGNVMAREQPQKSKRDV